MKLVIGGAFQGKTVYAGQKYGIEPFEWLDGSTCSRNEIFSAKGIKHFHEFIWHSMKNEENLDTFVDELIKRNPDIVIVTNELGYGIVPADAFDRRYRETEGRICQKLAAFSDEVDRVIAGIGVPIKKSGDESAHA